jgi:hypothetical protein
MDKNSVIPSEAAHSALVTAPLAAQSKDLSS